MSLRTQQLLVHDLGPQEHKKKEELEENKKKVADKKISEKKK